MGNLGVVLCLVTLIKCSLMTEEVYLDVGYVRVPLKGGLGHPRGKATPPTAKKLIRIS